MLFLLKKQYLEFEIAPAWFPIKEEKFYKAP